MFKFDFQVEQDENSPFSTKLDTDEHKCSAESTVIDWYDSEEVLPSSTILDNLDIFKLNATTLKLGEVDIDYVISGFLINDIAENESSSLDIKMAELNHSDLIPGVYEGGAKIWECTIDLLEYIASNYSSEKWQNKRALDLGCGSGLLGIFAYKNGAETHFQDYNKDVLEKITIPNILLNLTKVPHDLNELRNEIKFYCGDWSQFAKLTTQEQQFDVILSSETIYNTDNQQKLLDTIASRLKPDGVALIAAKIHYFGVGGGLRQFEELICKDKRFSSKVVWTSTVGVSREILELMPLNIS